MKGHFLLGRLIALLGVAAANGAEVNLGPLFQDHMVLQRDRPVPVWGTAAPGTPVSVAFAGQAVGAVAGADRRWEALLSPMGESRDGADLTVTAGKDSSVLHDVVVGDVWLCSGQSNMEFTVDDPVLADFRVVNAAEEVRAANYPLIRHFKVERQIAAGPAASAKGAWAVCSPATVPTFTAVGYFFAREIHRRLGVPIGLINSTWGGTDIAAWESPVSGGRPPPPPSAALTQQSPNVLFNGMVWPLLPCSIRGILWYQGEHNANEPAGYGKKFISLITAWRAHFGNPVLPFYWVQLAGFRPPTDKTGMSWAYLREEQARALALPGTGQAVAIDIGDPKTVHPRNKQEVGRRLALIAKAKEYGLQVDYSGPVFAGAQREGAGMWVSFRFADNALTAAVKPLQSFQLAGTDHRFHPATATIEGGAVFVRSGQVPAPVAVRYAWSDYPGANLYNGAGLPAAPFRSDDW